MSRIGKIARRTFLIGSAAIVGGVAFGIYQVRKPAPNPLEAAAGKAVLNPFVVVDQSGITLIAPRAEMGQGVHTSWAALIAEELDVDPAKVSVIHGPAAKAYYNSAILGDLLDGKGYDRSDLVYTINKALGGIGKVLNLQVTGGSTSMKDGFERMRYAGASARETLKEAAAQQLGVPRASLKTEDGKVIAQDGSELTYESLAEAASGLEPIKAGLRPARRWKYIGTSVPRVDMVAKVTGTAEFGVDVRLEGMKFAALRQAPHGSDGKSSFAASAAETMPGVEKVFDLGTAIAVVASNTWLAEQALDAIDVTWNPVSHPGDTDAMFEAIAAAFDGDANSTMRNDGDVDALPADATIVEAEYCVPYLAHATMEPMNATALYTGDAVEIWAPNQAPTMVQDRAAERAGLEREQVTVNTTFLGGGFGRRAETDYTDFAVQVAMEMPGTPVKLTWSREEDMQHDFYRPAAIARYRGAVKDGKAVSVHGKIAAQSPAIEFMGRALGSSMAGSDRSTVDSAFNQPFGIPNFRVEGYVAPAMAPVGFWRSVGSSFNGFFSDTIIDEMAVAAGRDLLDFRIELAEAEHAPSAEVLKAVKAMSGWTGQTPDGVGRGVGFAYSFGTPVAQVVEVVDADGAIRIVKCWIAADLGTIIDPEIVKAQMVSGAIYGLSAAVQEEITFAGGVVEQENFPDYDALRMHTAPVFEVQLLENMTHMGGAGEPGTPPSIPALANAVFDLTGTRVRDLPLNKSVDFLT